jgi:hypothetical protein
MNMHFSKKHNKKGLRKMTANDAKAMSTHAEAKAPIKPKEFKSKIPKGVSHTMPTLPTSNSGSMVLTQ